MNNAGRRGFSLLELLVVTAIVAGLSALLIPAVGRGMALARKAKCTHNLRMVQLAYTMYLDDHDGKFFPWREETPEGTLWFWGLESGGGAEGHRKLDRSKGRLASYLNQVGQLETCPALPYEKPYFKRKFETISYGYGLNEYLIEGTGANRRSGVKSFAGVTAPSETVTWGDAIQINTFQAPASPSNPMLEEWYMLDPCRSTSATAAHFHFRHLGQCSLAFADGSVRAMKPWRLVKPCDGKVGFLEPPNQDSLLRLQKE